MFYSHEVLTSRKYGVATVWLVATLGSKSNLKKINRKAILDVDIPKACQTVSNPDAPMALRLQSNLLYGISRIYFQQCTYTLVDVQAAQSNLKALTRVVRTSELDPNAGKARPEQLVLQDDPAFMPDDIYPMMDLDFSILESSQTSLRTSSLLSGASQQSSRSSLGIAPLPEIDVPSSGSGGAGFGGFEIPEPMPTSAEMERRFTMQSEEAGFLPDVDFNFDEEGNIIDFGAPHTPSVHVANAPMRSRTGSEVRERMIMEHAEGFGASQQLLEGAMDLDQPLLQDDQTELSPAEPFLEGEEDMQGEPSQVTQETSSEYIDAPQTRRPRGRRALPVDITLQIRNSDLQRWNDEYVEAMAEARRQKAMKRAVAQSKRNAAHFVFGSGLGGIGSGIGPSGLPHPLAGLFSGQALYRTFFPSIVDGDAATPTSRKRHSRSPSSDETTESETRRKRLNDAETGPELGRGEPQVGDDAIFPPIDADASIELAREALPLLSDPHSSQMPWNISSRAPSYASARPSRQGSITSAHRAPSITTPAGIAPSVTSFDRRASRLHSASPHVGRHGSVASEVLNVGGSSSAGGVGDTGMLLGLPSGGPEEAEEDSALRDFQLFGPTAEAGEPLVTAAQRESQATTASIDRESGNFLNFVREAVEVKKQRMGEVEGGVGEEEEEEEEGAEEGRGEAHDVQVSFEHLLPTEQHSKVVAAQAFLHVLALANRGLLSASQEVGRDEGSWWKPIMLGVTDGVFAI